MLFGLFPKFLLKGKEQNSSIGQMHGILTYRSYLREERGLERLPTFRKFMKICNMNQNSLSYQFQMIKLDEFVNRSRLKHVDYKTAITLHVFLNSVIIINSNEWVWSKQNLVDNYREYAEITMY